MRVQFVSDVHLEFQDFDVPTPPRDVLVLAGDIGVGGQALDLVETQLKHSPVLYVLGNHEFYNHDFDAVRQFWGNQSKSYSDFHVLDPGHVVIQDVLFIGGTLWTDYNNNDWHAKRQAQNAMNDHQIIRDGSNVFTSERAYQEHVKTLKYFGEVISSNPYLLYRKTVVVSHHLPHYRSVPERYKGHPLNPAFCSDLSRFVNGHTPDLWIHGHTHDSCDYTLGPTRVMCNPRGYAPFASNPNFDPAKIVEL